jgi:hypothetical protein
VLTHSVTTFTLSLSLSLSLSFYKRSVCSHCYTTVWSVFVLVRSVLSIILLDRTSGKGKRSFVFTTTGIILWRHHSASVSGCSDPSLYHLYRSACAAEQPSNARKGTLFVIVRAPSPTWFSLYFRFPTLLLCPLPAIFVSMRSFCFSLRVFALRTWLQAMDGAILTVHVIHLQLFLVWPSNHTQEVKIQGSVFGGGKSGRGFPGKIKWCSVCHRSAGDANIPGARWLYNATGHFITNSDRCRLPQRVSATSSTQIQFSFFSPEVQMMQCSVFHNSLSVTTGITNYSCAFSFPRLRREAHVSSVHW